MAPNKFPEFNDGNVEIRFSNDDTNFILHSHVLALHSTWFKASLSEQWSTGPWEQALFGGWKEPLDLRAVV